MSQPLRVAVTGAAGNIGYSLLFRLAAGDCYGPEQSIVLQMLEIPPAMKGLEGVAMELSDSAFPLLRGIEMSDDPVQAFKGANQVFLVGSKPRGKGMERSDLIRENGPIFVGQGQAIQKMAAADVRIVTVGNPCNTNCYIAMQNAPDLPRERFTAMTRLDQNRATASLAAKTGVESTAVENMVVWGNHSATQFPDFAHATVLGKPATEVVDRSWLEGDFLTGIQQRGAKIIEARGASSAASAAAAAIDHMRDWWTGTGDRVVSMSVPSAGQYGVPEGIIFSYPCRVQSGGALRVDEGVKFDAFGQGKFDKTLTELKEEAAVIQDLLV